VEVVPVLGELDQVQTVVQELVALDKILEQVVTLEVSVLRKEMQVLQVNQKILVVAEVELNQQHPQLQVLQVEQVLQYQLVVLLKLLLVVVAEQVVRTKETLQVEMVEQVAEDQEQTVQIVQVLKLVQVDKETLVAAVAVEDLHPTFQFLVVLVVLVS
jgi:hypothetical protein